MKLSRKAGEWSGKLVKGTTAAPNKTASWAKQLGHDVAEGYRSVVPKIEKTEESTNE
jgi:hypothetical protein